MWAIKARVIVVLAVLTVSACAGGSPTEPTPVGFAGEWSGPTSDGGTVSFTVSRAQTVVTVTVNYQFNGCAGTVMMTNLSIAVSEPQAIPGGGTLEPSFGSGTSGLDRPDFVGISGTFVANDFARGLLVFNQYANCGSAVLTWNARRR